MKTENSGSIFFIIMVSIQLMLVSNIALYLTTDLSNHQLISILSIFNIIFLVVFIFVLLISIKSNLLAIIILIISWAFSLSYSINESNHLGLLNNQNVWLIFKTENNCKLISKGTVNFLIFPLANNGWLCADGVIYYNHFDM
ncbi:hypothetical protein J3U21_04510 [Gilliamella sp. B2776]|uniref:hypothetical protein n=1 Tax=unclassified Gilliamella TaxID=2685620 RepID=UPI002269A493|nr:MULTISPECIES: hypothetical protein [unclassified Gilliamella]MCX8578722.1 hypothetical protein [Gilliamella sp. B2717]MCX8649604.1 hypothetical protein [Gilliamella sp. B2779]MCX8654878.1 hypothetical protein [Gilliamella sp. B2737]MCX8691406.1 hypothetical protein [Gilliamella sp. B2776]MCX8702533.1 hypothetical protein [Gilliamella sp. B2781]